VCRGKSLESLPWCSHRYPCIEVLYDEIAEGVFGVVKGPGVVVEAKDKSCERLVELPGHFAVVASVVVEFSASWRGSTVINGGSDSRNREDTGAKDAFGMDVVVFISDDGSNPTGNDAHCGTCV
jgi:hypothetical protein